MGSNGGGGTCRAARSPRRFRAAKECGACRDPAHGRSRAPQIRGEGEASFRGERKIAEREDFSCSIRQELHGWHRVICVGPVVQTRIFLRSCRAGVETEFMPWIAELASSKYMAATAGAELADDICKGALEAGATAHQKEIDQLAAEAPTKSEEEEDADGEGRDPDLEAQKRLGII